MKRGDTPRDWLPLHRVSRVSGAEPTGEAFRTEWIDFRRGIRMGNLEPQERITRILKHHLERRYAAPFVIDRWGRGVYWQWICWVSRANRAAKPLSHSVNFGCAKLFISVDRERRIFQSGLQVERGRTEGSSGYPGNSLRQDWDWHRLMAGCRKGSPLDGELGRLLLEEGFAAEIGDWEDNTILRKDNFTSAAQLRAASRRIASDRWGGFQLYYPMPAEELRACSGYELVQAVVAAFTEVVPAMNLCMQVPLQEPGPGRASPRSILR